MKYGYIYILKSNEGLCSIINMLRKLIRSSWMSLKSNAKHIPRFIYKFYKLLINLVFGYLGYLLCKNKKSEYLNNLYLRKMYPKTDLKIKTG